MSYLGCADRAAPAFESRGCSTNKNSFRSIFETTMKPGLLFSLLPPRRRVWRASRSSSSGTAQHKAYAKQAASGIRPAGMTVGKPGRAGVWWRLPCCARAGHTAGYGPVHPAAPPGPHWAACHRRRCGRNHSPGQKAALRHPSQPRQGIPKPLANRPPKPQQRRTF